MTTILESEKLGYSSFTSESENVDVFVSNILNSAPTYKTSWDVDFSTPADSWILDNDVKDSEDPTNKCTVGATEQSNGELIKSSENTQNFMIHEFANIEISRKRSHENTDENVKLEYTMIKKSKIGEFEPKTELHLQDAPKFKNSTNKNKQLENFEPDWTNQTQIMMDFELENPIEGYGNWDGLDIDLSPVFGI